MLSACPWRPLGVTKGPRKLTTVEVTAEQQAVANARVSHRVELERQRLLERYNIN